MFTGIIEASGKVLGITSNHIEIENNVITDDLKIGDSIAVNGVCLTVTNVNCNKFTADISPETYKITNLKNIKNNNVVNLERALSINGRFGGHIVSGHIDSVGTIVKILPSEHFCTLKIKLDKNQSKYVIKKGSVCIDGISLTVADVNNCIAEFVVIPHTYQNTNLKFLKTGDFVNIETDILAKYIEKFLLISDNKSGISLDFLQENGF